MYRFGSRNKRVLQGITKIVSSYRSEGKDPRGLISGRGECASREGCWLGVRLTNPLYKHLRFLGILNILVQPPEYVQNLIFMSHSKTCLVTGASKGIGHGVAQSLLDHAPPLSTIYLTSRTPPKIIHMNSTSSTLIYHPLDITTPFSIDALYKTIKEAGRTDVLVNNLGNATGSVEEIVECNYYGTINMCKKFIPILKPGGRVVNVSSIACYLGGSHDEELRAKMAAAGEGVRYVNREI